jgi:hypothetical protein
VFFPVKKKVKSDQSLRKNPRHVIAGHMTESNGKHTMNRVNPGTNFQLFRAVLGWLGLSEEGAALELSMSRDDLRRLKSGRGTPNPETRLKILNLSRRWPFGEILPDKWPEPIERPVERLGRGETA